MPYVAESLVVDKDNKLVALVYPDMDLVTREKLSEQQIESLMKENIANLNKALPSYSQLADVKILHEEFEKTPKRSIKRYLYQ